MVEEIRVEKCQYCGAAIPSGFDSCRDMLNTVLTKEYSDLAFGAVHLLTVDSYTLQHSEEHGPRSNAFHLMRLCRLVEHGDDPGLGRSPPREKAKAFEDDYRKFPFLEPPSDRGELTVADVVGVADAEEHAERVRHWALSVWEAWAQHHDWARDTAKLYGLG